MIFWGIVLMIGGLLAVLISFLSNLDMFAAMGEMGFAAWLTRFVKPAYLTSDKIFFLIGAVLVVIAAVMLIRGRIAAKKNGAVDATTKKAGKFLRDLKGEFKKVTWPTLSDVSRNTVVTLVMVGIVGLVVCLVDLGLSRLIMLLLSIGG